MAQPLPGIFRAGHLWSSYEGLAGMGTALIRYYDPIPHRRQDIGLGFLGPPQPCCCLPCTRPTVREDSRQGSLSWFPRQRWGYVHPQVGVPHSRVSGPTVPPDSSIDCLRSCNGGMRCFNVLGPVHSQLTFRAEALSGGHCAVLSLTDSTAGPGLGPGTQARVSRFPAVSPDCPAQSLSGCL